MLADVLNCPVEIPNSFESGCLGAIVMAMKSLGIVDSLEAVQQFIGEKEVCKPDSEAVAVYQKYQPVFEQVQELLSPAYARMADLQQKTTNH